MQLRTDFKAFICYHKIRVTIMATYYGKTAEVWISDLCDEQGAIIEWKQLGSRKSKQSSKQVECLLVYRFTDKELQANGFGPTIDEAKENAAVGMLFNQLEFTLPKLFVLTRDEFKLAWLTDYFVPLNLATNAGSVSPQTSAGTNESTSDTEEVEYNAVFNYIGALQEACVARNWQLPDYQEERRSGPQHAPSFTMKCKVGPIEKRAESGNKKEAKSMAAYKVYEKLKKLKFNLEKVNDSQLQPAESTFEEVMNEITRQMDRVSLKGPSSYKSEFMNAYRDIIQTYLSSHHNQEIQKFAVTILDWICQRSGITLEFYEPLLFIDDQDGCFHSVLKIRLPFCNYSPSFVMVEGMGHSKNDSMQDCAQSALRLLVEE